MNTTASPVRSTLHALEPIGRGTPDVESLVSYFCRLAVSHSTTTDELGRYVTDQVGMELAPEFDWHARQLSGLREAALSWSSALSALTGVPSLDGLTFLPWSKVIAQNGRSLVTAGQFCPACLSEDLAVGRTPYLRLAWESAEVTVCHRHGTPLKQHCHACGRTNVRHAAAVVVPGWCTKCGAFLGGEEEGGAFCESPDLAARWKARHLAGLVCAQHTLTKRPERADLIGAIEHVIASMDGGQAASFARRHGIGKSSVHHWLKGPGTPKLDVSLSIALHSGLTLAQLLTGNTQGWTPPDQNIQLALGLDAPARPDRAPAREIDWLDVETQLQSMLQAPEPIPVLEAARRLGVEARQLYLRANRVTRELGARWTAFTRSRRDLRLAVVRPHLEAVARDVLATGRALNRREAAKHLPPEMLASVPRLDEVLRDVQSQVLAEQDAGAQRPGC
jgi:RNA polymerase subunit RPABC4/transcription elongation factor Spt4